MIRSFDIRSTVLLQEWGGFIILQIQHWTQINIPFEHSTRYRGKTNRVLHTTSDTYTLFKQSSGAFIVKRRTCTQHPQEHDNHSNKTTSTTTSSHSKTDRRRWGEEGVGFSPPGIGSLPFWSASVLLMFARNWCSQCAMTCDCHCAPWPTGGDEWKGDNRLVWRTGGMWCHSLPIPTHRHTHAHTHTHTHP